MGQAGLQPIKVILAVKCRLSRRSNVKPPYTDLHTSLVLVDEP